MIRTNRFAMAFVIACAYPAAYAQGVATDKVLTPVEVTAARAPLDPNLPNTTASKTRENLREQNLFNPEDALKYLPGTTIRKRYIGDRNALIGGRSFSTLQAPRGLVLMDGYLISSFLGRFDAPRWNMVAPEEMERVDVLYGPYSALYPGNSIGTTVVITTRTPQQFEASARLTAAQQRFEHYGVAGDFNSYQASAFMGDRLDNGLYYSIGLNKQDSTSHPMQYFTVSANAAGAFPGVAPGAATAVSGVRYDTDPKGLRRAVFGANAGAIDHTLQDQAKFKLGYAFSPALVLDGFLAYWRNDSTNSNQTFIRDAAGNPVWSGKISHDGNTFMIPAATFAPSRRNEEHRQAGLTLKTKNQTGWNGSIAVSDYDAGKDIARSAFNPEPVAQAGGSGSVTRRDGTGWSTFEAQASYKPVKGDFGGGQHALTVGLQRSAYELKNVVFDTADWRTQQGAVDQNFAGRTRLLALYAQDAWRFATHWGATFGLRQEFWEASDGFQFISGAAPVTYAGRRLRATSPKLSVSWNPVYDLLVRASFGRGVRFPTVDELYNGTRSGTSIQTSDPNLKPERADSMELAMEKTWDKQQLRVSAFQDDTRDTILRQTNTAVVPHITNTQNVQRVRARGIEMAWSTQDLFMPGFNLEANAAWVHARTLESNFVAAIGKNWVRVPRVRANWIASYRPNARWMASLALRHSGRQYNELDNSDIHPDTYGGVSSYTVADLRLSYKPTRQAELALGLDNLTDQRYYQSHPYPGRTLFAELRLSY
jgi:iron complex outermembrane receptor protein